MQWSCRAAGWARAAALSGACLFVGSCPAPLLAAPFDRLANLAQADTTSPLSARLSSADAARSGIEWRLLGPAFSFHFSHEYAPLRQAAQWHECASANAEAGCYLATDGHYYKVDAGARRGWHQNNPAIGVSWTRRDDEGRADSLSAGLVTDSFGELGAIGLAAHLWPVSESASYRLEAGLAGGLWYRTQRDGGPHTVVPVAMPALSFSHRPSGLGFNLGYAPKLSIAGRGNRVEALMLQTTLAF